MRKGMNDLILGAVLFTISVLGILLARGPGEHIDATLLFITIPMAIYEVTIGLRRVYRPRKEQRKMAEIIEIRSVRGHYEAYLRGRFVCSGDTRRECEETAEDTIYGAA